MPGRKTLSDADEYKHCCKEMDGHLKDGELPLFFNGEQQPEYGIKYPRIVGGGYQILRHCPWCGSRLPRVRRR